METTVTMESTKKATTIVDLNDDCLREIFKFLTLIDLCSVTEASTKSSIRLKAISNEMFERTHKVWSFSENHLCTSHHEAKRIFSNFGFLVSTLKLNYPLSWISPSFNKNDLIDWVITYCSTNLVSLEIQHNEISLNQTLKLRRLFKKLRKLRLNNVIINGDGRNLLACCESLIELDVAYLNHHEIILENTFPKLERVSYTAQGNINLEGFVERHRNLKTFSMWSDNQMPNSMSIIAENCKKLNKLEVSVATNVESFEYESALLRILKFEYLNELTIHCHDRNITKFIQNLTSLKSLNALSLFFAPHDLEFISSLTQLKQIRRLVLFSGHEYSNLDQLGDMDLLTHLSIVNRWENESINFDVVKIIERLINLKSLVLSLTSFKMDKETYVRIVNVIRKRLTRPQFALQIFCEFDDNFVDSKDHHHIVQMQPAECGESLIDSSFLCFYYSVD